MACFEQGEPCSDILQWHVAHIMTIHEGKKRRRCRSLMWEQVEKVMVEICDVEKF